LHIADSPTGPGLRHMQTDPPDQTALTTAKLLWSLAVVVIAARARNAGIKKLPEMRPELDYVF